MERWRAALWWLSWLGLSGLAGCAPAGAPLLLPTLGAAAVVPSPTIVVHWAALPFTYTPPPPAPLIAPTLAPRATPTARATVDPTATAAPVTPTAPAVPGFAMVEPPARVPCDGPGQVFAARFPSHLGARRYRAYLPPCYGLDGRAFPVLYLFHGSIQDETHWLDLGLADALDGAIGSGQVPPFIVVMPYNGALGNQTSGGPNSVEGLTVGHLLPYVDSRFCSWPARAGRSLGGISRGGYWALAIAFRHPGLFAGVAGHSSHLRFETDAPRYNPLATYAQYDLSGLRIWLDWGETDFLRPGQEQLRDALAAAGIPHRAAVFPGGHNDAYWQAHLSEYLAWHGGSWPRERAAYPICDR